MTQLLDNEAQLTPKKTRCQGFARARRAGHVVLAAGALIVCATGCSAEMHENIDEEDQKVIALMQGLQPEAAVQLEALGKESLGSFSSWASNSQPPHGEDISMGALAGYDRGQVFSVWGMCTGAEGTLPVDIGGIGAFELDCAPADGGLALQVLVENLVVEQDSIEFTVAGAPRGSAWHLEVVDEG